MLNMKEIKIMLTAGSKMNKIGEVVVIKFGENFMKNKISWTTCLKCEYVIEYKRHIKFEKSF